MKTTYEFDSSTIIYFRLWKFYSLPLHQLLENRLDRNNTNSTEQNTALVAFVTDDTVQLHSVSVNQRCIFGAGCGSFRITIDILHSLSDNLFKMDISICFLRCLISFRYIASSRTSSLAMFNYNLNAI